MIVIGRLKLRLLVLSHPLLGLVNDPKDFRVAADDDDAWNEECNDEECSLAASSVHVGQDGARLEFLIVAELSPHAEQRGQLKAIGEEPAEHDHRYNPFLRVNLRHISILCDHDVAIDGNHGDT